MSSYQLHISHLGQRKGVEFKTGQALKVKATDNSSYQLLNEKGELIPFDKIAQVQKNGQDLLVFLEEGTTTPDLILEDYLSFHHIENTAALKSANVTFSTVSETALVYTPITATEMVTASSSSSAFGGISLFTVGAVAATVAVVGVVAAAAGGGGGKGGDTPALAKSSEEISSEEILPKETSSEEITSKEISSEEVSSKEMTSQETSSEEISSKEISSEEILSEEVSSEETSSEEILSEEVSSEETSSEEISSEETSSEEIKSEEHTDDIQIEITSVAGVDNFINVTEAKAQYTQIKGKISGEDASADSLVNILLNDGSSISATVLNDLTFTAQVETSKLLANQGYSVQAVVSGLNNAKNETTATYTYTVAADAIAKVDITEINTNFTAYENLNSITKLKGNVEFSGVFAYGMNAKLVNSFQVIIGNKSYTAVLYGDHTTFELNIPTSELTLLNGQSISFDFGGKQKASLPNARTSGILSFGSESAYDVTYSSLTLNSDYIAVNEDGSYSVQMPESLALVSGTVSGVAKAGDSVEIVLNDTLYSTQVQLDNSFHISVPAEQLANNNEKVLTATLITKDLAGNEIRVNDVESYLTATEISSDYVQSTQERIVHSQRKYNHLAQENEDEYNYPYFMDMLRARNIGFNVNVPMNGEGKVIYYHIVSSDIAEEKIATLWRSSLYDNSKGEWSDFSEKHQTMLHEIFEKLSSYLNVKFEYSDSFIEDSSGINIFKGPYHSDTSSGVSSSNHAFSLLSTNENSPAANALWTNDDWFYYVAIHEILHGFDFGHTSDYFTDENAYGGMGAGSLEDSTLFSYQSYNYNTIVGKQPRFGDPNYRYLYEVNTGLHIAGYDLAALHYRYGVNPEARSGNDVYTFQRYQKTDDFGGVYIWDGGGVDTFDASNENESVYINLKPGSWIYRGEQDTVLTIKSQTTYDAVEWFANMGYTNRIAGENSTRTLTEYAEGQAFIGYGTQIENAIGSDYNDIIIGNEADNNLLGGKGDDILKGGKGNDYLDGGEGADEMNGGEGDDTFVVDNASDKVIENADEGIDTVLSFVDYTLGDNVENLTLMGTTATQATGNALDNIITANNAGATLDGKAGDDRLIGGLGEDTLIGGEGNDIFVFQTTLNGNVDIIRDFSTGDKIELSKAIFTAIDSVENIMNYIQFEEGKLSYQESSAVDAIHFATLENVASLDQSYFVLA